MTSMQIKTEVLIDQIAKLIRQCAPRVSKDKLFLRKVLEVMGIYVPTVPSEIKNTDKVIAGLKNAYRNIHWFNYKGLCGVVVQYSTTKEVAFIPILYCPGGHPSGGYVYVGGEINVPDEQQLLLELYYLLSQGLHIPDHTPQEMVMIALFLKVGTLDQKIEALLRLGFIDPSDSYPDILIENMAASIIGNH